MSTTTNTLTKNIHQQPDDRPITTFSSRGPCSENLLSLLGGQPTERSAPLDAFADLVERTIANTEEVIVDDDLQLTLFILYGLAYGGVVETNGDWEWNPALIRARRSIEVAFEDALRTRISLPALPAPTGMDVAASLFALAASDTGPSLSRFVAQRATRDQAIEFVIQRSIYTLKEADPHSWAIPRLTGRPKAALVEIQADEYGGGRPDRVHAEIFAGTMRALGLDSAYGTYVDDVPAITLASLNMMSMFGLNRRLRGAITGHLAAFEMTSSIPNRFYGNGFRRLGFGADVTWYFDEHVEADAVHEQIAARDLAGSLAEDHPELLPDIFFGAAACLAMDGWVGAHILDAWTAGASSLRRLPAPSNQQ